MAVSLRSLTQSDASILQRLYDVCPAAFTSLRPPRPARPGRNRSDPGAGHSGAHPVGVFLDQDLIGFIDCKLNADIPDGAHLGLLLLASPYDDPTIASSILRILTRWLMGLGIVRLETCVPAHDAAAIRFWLGQGFRFTANSIAASLPVMRRGSWCWRCR